MCIDISPSCVSKAPLRCWFYWLWVKNTMLRSLSIPINKLFFLFLFLMFIFFYLFIHSSASCIPSTTQPKWVSWRKEEKNRKKKILIFKNESAIMHVSDTNLWDCDVNLGCVFVCVFVSSMARALSHSLAIWLSVARRWPIAYLHETRCCLCVLAGVIAGQPLL